MPRGILAEAKFSTWDGGITYGTVYEICETKYLDDVNAYQFSFYDDAGDIFHTYYYLEKGSINDDLFQFYFQF